MNAFKHAFQGKKCAEKHFLAAHGCLCENVSIPMRKFLRKILKPQRVICIIYIYIYIYILECKVGRFAHVFLHANVMSDHQTYPDESNPGHHRYVHIQHISICIYIYIYIYIYIFTIRTSYEINKKCIWVPKPCGFHFPD